jgi:hypothetical protein
MFADFLLYAGQAVAAAILAAVLEFGFRRRYEPHATWVVVMWGVAQVGLLVALRLAIAPIAGADAQAGAWAAWWLVFWSFCAAAVPVVGWQLAIQRSRIVFLLAYMTGRGR